MVADDILQGLAEKLGTSTELAGLFLGVCVLASVGIAMSALRVNIVATAIVLLAVAGVLTGFGWLPIWFLIGAILIIVAFSAKEISVIFK